MTKNDLRREGLALRDALSPEFRAQASLAIAVNVLALPELASPRGLVVAGYWPIRSEVDPRPTFEALAVRGVRLALPAVLGDEITFRAWASGEALASGPFGLSEPAPEAAETAPDVLLTPLSRYDRARNRIGYGKGHYDLAIAKLAAVKPVLTIGLAFSVQATANIAAEGHDRRLDIVVTETEILRD
ncbi:MAG: 5-formyltetrahydrofolate cyclo-ligase [Salinarimonadaceae bacterium]|nr:MAG: 5-formyltetrahydrofolate cyclo-ligase [Salinarimonadaceae bacterium]